MSTKKKKILISSFILLSEKNPKQISCSVSHFASLTVFSSHTHTFFPTNLVMHKKSGKQRSKYIVQFHFIKNNINSA